MRIFISLACSFYLAASGSAADSPHPFSVHDLLAMERISDPQPSADGQQIVFVLRSTDLDADRGRTDLWLVNADGSNPRPLTRHEAADHNPRWAPDGKAVFFLSTRSGSSQIWRIPTDAGEASKVTDLPLDVSNLVVSPDGARLAFTLDVFPECETVECTDQRLQERKKTKSSAQVYDRLFVRHWDTWKDGRRSHLFVLPVEGGEPLNLTRGMDADIPSKPFGGPEEITFHPDAQSLVFTARDAGRTEAWSTDFNLYAVPVDGSAIPVALTAPNPAWDTQPKFSPDGRTLAYLAMNRAGFEADRFRIMLKPWPNGEPRVLAEDWDRSPMEILFSHDGRTIYATAADVGQVGLFAIAVASGTPRQIVSTGSTHSPALLGDDQILFGHDHLRSPVELYSVGTDGDGLRQISRINQERIDRTRMGDPEHFQFRGWNDEPVHAYVVKPASFDSSAKYPVAFLIHGGPQGSFNNNFHYRWNPQVYAGAGFAAVMVDFHGSTGYGQAFTDSISGDWGGKPLEDLKKGLAAALERFPWLDGNRVAALGASYGGYMVNWIAGQWPGRFRCLVNHDGVFDLRSMYFTTEELWFPEWEFTKPYWQAPESYEEFNPVNHVARWETPMLVIHGSLDFRVPIEQGLGAFTALQRKGIPSKFLHFPDENHWVLRPTNSIRWHETVLDWLAQWTRPQSPSQP